MRLDAAVLDKHWSEIRIKVASRVLQSLLARKVGPTEVIAKEAVQIADELLNTILETQPAVKGAAHGSNS